MSLSASQTTLFRAIHEGHRGKVSAAIESLKAEEGTGFNCRLSKEDTFALDYTLATFDSVSSDAELVDHTLYLKLVGTAVSYKMKKINGDVITGAISKDLLCDIETGTPEEFFRNKLALNQHIPGLMRYERYEIWQTPLLFALSIEELDIARLLLRQPGIDVIMTNMHLVTPLHMLLMSHTGTMYEITSLFCSIVDKIKAFHNNEVRTWEYLSAPKVPGPESYYFPQDGPVSTFSPSTHFTSSLCNGKFYITALLLDLGVDPNSSLMHELDELRNIMAQGVEYFGIVKKIFPDILPPKGIGLLKHDLIRCGFKNGSSDFDEELFLLYWQHYVSNGSITADNIEALKLGSAAKDVGEPFEGMEIILDKPWHDSMDPALKSRIKILIQGLSLDSESGSQATACSPMAPAFNIAKAFDQLAARAEDGPHAQEHGITSPGLPAVCPAPPPS